MILINLLPHREEARNKRKQDFHVRLLLSVVAGLAVGGMVWKFYDYQINAQERVNRHFEAANAKLDEQIEDVKEVEAEILALRERQQAVEGLQQDRNTLVRLFNELAAKMPDGMFFTSMKQTGAAVALEGVAQSNERVSEFLRNLKDSELLDRQAQLDQTLVQEISLSDKRKSKAYAFKLVLTLHTKEDAEQQARSSGNKSQ